MEQQGRAACLLCVFAHFYVAHTTKQQSLQALPPPPRTLNVDLHKVKGGDVVQLGHVLRPSTHGAGDV